MPRVFQFEPFGWWYLIRDSFNDTKSLHQRLFLCLSKNRKQPTNRWNVSVKIILQFSFRFSVQRPNSLELVPSGSVCIACLFLILPSSIPFEFKFEFYSIWFFDVGNCFGTERWKMRRSQQTVSNVSVCYSVHALLCCSWQTWGIHSLACVMTVVDMWIYTVFKLHIAVACSNLEEQWCAGIGSLKQVKIWYEWHLVFKQQWPYVLRLAYNSKLPAVFKLYWYSSLNRWLMTGGPK